MSGGVPTRSNPTRPAFFDRTTKAAERSAIRTQADEADCFEIIEGGEDVEPKFSHATGTFGHRKRRSNKVSTYHKRISADLDSDDELILTMRDKGYTDAQIADRLAREGRARYDRKSISTRIARIRLAQAAHHDFLLKEGYEEWKLEDDKLLMQAFALADIEVQYEIERTRAWRFKKVSEYMRRLDKNSNFSENACRERYQDIMAGTATIPTDQCDDPDARRKEVAAYVEKRERERQAEFDAKEQKEARERKIKEEARLRNAQKAEEVAKRRATKQEEKMARAQKRARDNQLKLQRAQQNRINKIAKAEKLKADRIAAKAAAEQAIRDMNPNTPVKGSVVTKLRNAKTDRDPRLYLSLQDVQHMCKARDIDNTGASKEELVERLKSEDMKRPFEKLKQLCRTRGLNTAGTKATLSYQLALSEARCYSSFQEGMDAEADDDE
jgi:hypothetical protein